MGKPIRNMKNPITKKAPRDEISDFQSYSIYARSTGHYLTI